MKQSRAKSVKKLKSVKYSPLMLDEYLNIIIENRRETFTGTEQEFAEHMELELQEILSEITQTMRGILAKACIGEIKYAHRYEASVIKEIANKHKGSIQLFDFIIQFNKIIARECYLRYRKRFKTPGDRVKLETLNEIHSRACQVVSEINLLVKNGFADGAQARWRSLHELCITFLFLYDHDVSVSEMYNDYITIESYDKILKYRDAHPKLNWTPISQKEVDDLAAEREVLINKYGKGFARKCGWTMNVLPADKRHIKGIEEAVEQDSLRGIYSWASDNVHAGVLGNRNRMGLPRGKEHYLLTGPSAYGLLDPMQYTSFSLIEMTNAFLALEDTLLNDIKLQMQWGFHDAMVELLLKESKSIKKKRPKQTQKK